MWNCANCGELLEDHFEACWKCSTLRDSEPADDSVDNESAPPPTEHLPHNAPAGALPAQGSAKPTRPGQPQSRPPRPIDLYKVVPFVGRISTGMFSTDNANTVAGQMQAAIEREAIAGWDFHSFAKVDVEVKPGCLASLFGARAAYVTFDQLVFRAKSQDQ